jgi:hypothetical protein
MIGPTTGLWVSAQPFVLIAARGVIVDDPLVVAGRPVREVQPCVGHGRHVRAVASANFLALVEMVGSDSGYLLTRYDADCLEAAVGSRKHNGPSLKPDKSAWVG